jgi:hypothetical protein
MEAANGYYYSKMGERSSSVLLYNKMTTDDNNGYTHTDTRIFLRDFFFLRDWGLNSGL